MLDADEHSQVLVFLRHLIETGPQETMLLSLVDTYGRISMSRPNACRTSSSPT